MSIPVVNASDGQRRISTRKPVPRIPYVSGSGGGLAPRDHDRHLAKRPTNQRWFYDSTPSSVPALVFDPPRPLNCFDSAAHHTCFQSLNPSDSDDSEDSELNDEELVESIIESTCINTLDDWGGYYIRLVKWAIEDPHGNVDQVHS